MKRWLKVSISLIVVFATLAGAIYQGYFRTEKGELDEQYARLREIGVPTNREEYAEMQKGRTPIEEFVRESKAFQSNPAFMNFRAATVSPPKTAGLVNNPKLAKQSIEDLSLEFASLRKLVERSDNGYAYPLDLAGAPLIGASRDAFSTLVRRSRTHLALGEVDQAVDWSLLHYRIAKQFAHSKSQDAFWEANQMTGSSCRELSELLPYIANDSRLVDRMLAETSEPMPSTDIFLAQIDLAAVARERFANRDPLRDLRAAFPDLKKMREASVSNRLQSSRDFLDKWISFYEALRSLPDDLSRIEDAANNDPILKKWNFLKGNVRELKDSRIRWELLRAALLVLDYRLRHGRLPSSSSEFKMPSDCLTRQPLKYKQTTDGFIVYSPRADGDQGGLELPPNENWKPQDIVVKVKLSGEAGIWHSAPAR